MRLGHPARLLSVVQRHSLDALVSSSDSTSIVRDVRRDMDQALVRPCDVKSEISSEACEPQGNIMQNTRAGCFKAQFIGKSWTSSRNLHKLKQRKTCSVGLFFNIAIQAFQLRIRLIFRNKRGPDHWASMTNCEKMPDSVSTNKSFQALVLLFSDQGSKSKKPIRKETTLSRTQISETRVATERRWGYQGDFDKR